MKKIFYGMFAGIIGGALIYHFDKRDFSGEMKQGRPTKLFNNLMKKYDNLPVVYRVRFNGKMRDELRKKCGDGKSSNSRLCWNEPKDFVDWIMTLKDGQIIDIVKNPEGDVDRPLFGDNKDWCYVPWMSLRHKQLFTEVNCVVCGGDSDNKGSLCGKCENYYCEGCEHEYMENGICATCQIIEATGFDGEMNRKVSREMIVDYDMGCPGCGKPVCLKDTGRCIWCGGAFCDDCELNKGLCAKCELTDAGEYECPECGEPRKRTDYFRKNKYTYFCLNDKCSKFDREEACRMGLLMCPDCGEPMEMYGKPRCFWCKKPEIRKYDVRNMIESLRYLEHKREGSKNRIWSFLNNNGAIPGNDKIGDISWVASYIDGDDEDLADDWDLFEAEFPDWNDVWWMFSW